MVLSKTLFDLNKRCVPSVINFLNNVDFDVFVKNNELAMQFVYPLIPIQRRALSMASRLLVGSQNRRCRCKEFKMQTTAFFSRNEAMKLRKSALPNKVCYLQSDNTKQMNLSNNLASLKGNFKHIYVQAYPQCVEIRHTDTTFTFTAGICHVSMRSTYSCRIGRHIFLPAEFNVFALPRVLGVGETGHVIF